MGLAHSRRGSGPPLIVIRQIDPAAFWAPTIDALAGHFDVVAVDLPGFGDSPPLTERPSVAALTGALATWIPTVDLGGATVVGNSLGGAVAIELAKRGAVGGAVAISPIGFWGPREAAKALRVLRVGSAFARAVASRPGLITRTRPGRAIAFGQLVAHPARMPEPTARAALRSLATAPGFEATRRALLPYRLEGPEPTVPVTIAWAAKDRMTPPHQARRAREVLPGARFVTLDGCGHAAMVDDPRLVAGVVREAAGSS